MKNLGLFSWLSKRKLSEEQVACVFVNTTFESVEQGWPEIAAFLNEAPGFVQSPNLDPEDYGRFLMINVAASDYPANFQQIRPCVGHCSRGFREQSEALPFIYEASK